jgi:hypothetical protein
MFCEIPDSIYLSILSVSANFFVLFSEYCSTKSQPMSSPIRIENQFRIVDPAPDKHPDS